MPAIVKPAAITWGEVLRRTWKEAWEDDILGRSAQLSYYFFLALFPALICIIAILNIFPSKGESVRNELLEVFSNVLPASASDLIRKTMNEVSPAAAKSKLSIGIIFSLWSASAGMSAIMDTLNAEYEVPETRSFIRRSAISLGLTVVCALLLLAALTIVLAGSSTADAYSGGTMATFLKLVQWPVAIGFMLLDFALIYFFAPNVVHQKWHWITPGAISALFLWMLASVGLKIYLHFFNLYTATYGSLGAVIILLLWFYLTGAAMLIGAEINSVIEDAAAKAGEPDAKLKGEFSPQR
jgi:membrane protein